MCPRPPSTIVSVIRFAPLPHLPFIILYPACMSLPGVNWVQLKDSNQLAHRRLNLEKHFHIGPKYLIFIWGHKFLRPFKDFIISFASTWNFSHNGLIAQSHTLIHLYLIIISSNTGPPGRTFNDLLSGSYFYTKLGYFIKILNGHQDRNI